MDRYTESEKKRRRLEQERNARRLVYLFVLITSIIMILLLVFAFFLGRMTKSTEAMNINTNEAGVLTGVDIRRMDSVDSLAPVNTDFVYSWEEENQRYGERTVLIAENDNILTLVNQEHHLPAGWNVDLVYLINEQSIDRRAYEDLQNMMDDCRAEGLHPLICSSYRSHERQIELYDQKVNDLIGKGYTKEQAEIEAAKWIAVPGTSEHELGLALDIVDESYQELEKEQEDTDVQKWLMQNSYKYGFILRYPEDKVSVTGISYEPWHYRYVGIEAATYIYEHGICLEEYLSSK